MQLAVPVDWIEDKPHWSCTYACGSDEIGAVCENCGKHKTELLHVYSGENRAVKIFICPSECVQALSVWSTQVLYFEDDEEEEEIDTGGFSNKASEWEVDDGLLDDMLNMDDLFAAPTEKPKPKKESRKRKAEAAGFFLDFVPEPSPKIDDAKIKELMDRYKMGAHAMEAWSAIDDDDGSQMDLITSFQTRIERSPNQIIRYEWKGEPLPFDRSVNAPRCLSCQEQTFFEFQIMPHLINIVGEKFEHLDFLTVFGFTCENCDEVRLIIHREEEQSELAELIQKNVEEEISAKQVTFSVNNSTVT